MTGAMARSRRVGERARAMMSSGAERCGYGVVGRATTVAREVWGGGFATRGRGWMAFVVGFEARVMRDARVEWRWRARDAMEGVGTIVNRSRWWICVEDNYG